MSDPHHIVTPFVTLGFNADGQVKAQIDMRPIAGTTTYWFGQYLAAVTRGYVDAMMHLNDLGEIKREQLESQVAQGFNEELAEGPSGKGKATPS